MPLGKTQDLTVKGEAIERTYANYGSNKYIVNRRYQRKLIWSIDEKRSFIDSIAKGYPVPIILLAEDRQDTTGNLEIIDGMQRLNAVASFIENDYAVEDGYFDLESMAITKAALDDGKLIQKLPKLARNVCVDIASYQLPFSIYEFAAGESVDEVFRRINSGGRQLSRQELRAAGSTGHFAQLVRQIAAKVRGDDSNSDILTLNGMKNISITNKDFDYGIQVDDLFWITNGILTKELVRESRDEELIADILAYMLLDPPPASRSEFIDDFFQPGLDEASKKRFADLDVAVQKRTPELVIKDFQRTFDELAYTVGQSGTNLGKILFQGSIARFPRYFQVVFLAFHELIVKRRKRPGNQDLLVAKMTGSSKHIQIAEGGGWGAETRQDAVNSCAGLYSPCFVDDDTADPAVIHWISQLQNILSQSYTEQSSYDFKQGFTTLKMGAAFDEESFRKILATCVGISNLKRNARGYVLVGVAENLATANRVRDIYGVASTPFERFYITGVEHEAMTLGKNLDQFFQIIVEKIKSSGLSDDLKGYIARNLKPVRYYDKTVYVFEVQAQKEPSSLDGLFYDRSGAQVNEIDSRQYANLFRRFI